MDLASKHWLRRFEKEFVPYCREHRKTLNTLYSHDEYLEHFVYKILHVSGLLFGHPVKPLFYNHPEFHEWPNSEKMKYIFVESLYHVYFYTRRDELMRDGDVDFYALFFDATESITDFYSHFARQHTSSTFNFPTLFHTHAESDRKLEKIINERHSNASIMQKKFWTGAVYNTFIYLDLTYYALWFEYPEKKYHERHEYIQLQVLKIILASFLSKDHLQWKDRNILNYFLSSAIVSDTTQDRLQVYLQRGLTASDISFNDDVPDLFRLIYLEIGIISAYADQSISDTDMQYIDSLADKLKLDDETKENSMLMVESFIQRNAHDVLYLKNRHNLDLFSSSINQRLFSMVKKNKGKIVREISESRELVELLWKAQNKQLTKEEKEKVRSQISDLLRTIPSLAIFIVPGGSFLLPILLKILPDELLKPSQFRN